MASDDAAGLAISNRLGADIRISTQARRNAFDGIAMLTVGDGVLEEVTSLLTRAAELTEQAATGTINTENRQAIDLEYQKIVTAIADLGANTLFNGTSVFTTGEIGISVADFTRQIVTVGAMAATLSSDLTTTENAVDLKPLLSECLQSVSMQRASIGASIQNLNSYANTLGIQVENFTAANSQIRDANIADEVINLTKFQILNQSGTSSLGQANQSAQSVLSLLR
jgi:flagellin